MEVVVGAQSTPGPQEMTPLNSNLVLVVKMIQGQQDVVLQSHKVDQCTLHRLLNNVRRGKCYERSDYLFWRTVHTIQSTLEEETLRDT